MEMRRRMQARLYFYVKQFTIDYLTKEQQNKLHEDYQTTIGFGQLTLSIINRTPDANAVPITCGEQYFYFPIYNKDCTEEMERLLTATKTGWIDCNFDKQVLPRFDDILLEYTPEDRYFLSLNTEEFVQTNESIFSKNAGKEEIKNHTWIMETNFDLADELVEYLLKFLPEEEPEVRYNAARRPLTSETRVIYLNSSDNPYGMDAALSKYIRPINQREKTNENSIHSVYFLKRGFVKRDYSGELISKGVT